MNIRTFAGLALALILASCSTSTNHRHRQLSAPTGGLFFDDDPVPNSESEEVRVTFMDTDGDGLPDARGLRRNGDPKRRELLESRVALHERLVSLAATALEAVKILNASGRADDAAVRAAESRHLEARIRQVEAELDLLDARRR